MKALVLYGSTRGNTKLVAQRLVEQLEFAAEVKEVSTLAGPAELYAFDLMIVMASTWGDGELQIDMENFLAREGVSLAGKPYVICELGNYYGYDDFEFGALRIMQSRLETWGGEEWQEPFCMDSLPRKDWLGLSRWCAALNARAREVQ